MLWFTIDYFRSNGEAVPIDKCQFHVRLIEWFCFQFLRHWSRYAFSTNVVPPLITTISGEFHVGYTSFGGYVVTLQYVFFAVACFTGGWISHRFGLSNRFLMIAGLILMGIVMTSASTFGSYKWFIIWAIPLGYSGATVETFNAIMLCRIGGPASSKMLNMGQVFFCVGAITAPLVVAGVLDRGLSWRWAFLGLGINYF